MHPRLGSIAAATLGMTMTGKNALAAPPTGSIIGAMDVIGTNPMISQVVPTMATTEHWQTAATASFKESRIPATLAQMA